MALSMQIKCISNNPNDAKATQRYLGAGSGSNLNHFPLTVGKKYAVYAVATIDKATLYLLLDDDQDSDDYPLDEDNFEPVWYDAALFEIVDPIIDPTWKKMKGTMWTRRGETVSFPEFVEEGRRFYEDLLEGHDDAIKIFLTYVRKYKK